MSNQEQEQEQEQEPTKGDKTQNLICLPRDMELQILHKLPIKSVIRFTSVSKTFLSLIKNPTFISTHRKLSISSPPNKTPLLLFRYYDFDDKTEYYSLRFDNHNFDNYRHLHFPFKVPKRSPGLFFTIIGTINGLICLAFNFCNPPIIIIWNPVIGKYVSLPEPLITSYKTYEISFGFGFDPLTNDYKVLKLVIQHDDSLAAEFYSVNTNSWTTVAVDPGYEILCCHRQVFVRGALHCLARRRVGNDGKYRNIIVAFDVGDEQFKEIMLPEKLANGPFSRESLPNWPVQYFSLSVCNQSMTLALFDRYDRGLRPPGVIVWVMQQYGREQSWSMIRNVAGYQRLLGLSKNRGLFLTPYRKNEICCFMPDKVSRCSRVGASVRSGFGGNSPFVDYFVESMELLNNPNAESDVSVENIALANATGDGDAPAGAVGDAAGDPPGGPVGDAPGDAND